MGAWAAERVSRTGAAPGVAGAWARRVRAEWCAWGAELLELLLLLLQLELELLRLLLLPLLLLELLLLPLLLLPLLLLPLLLLELPSSELIILHLKHLLLLLLLLQKRLQDLDSRAVGVLLRRCRRRALHWQQGS